MSRLSRSACILLFCIAYAVPAPAADAPDPSGDVKPLVAKIITAYGGEKVVEGLTGIHAVGDITAIMRRDRGTYEFYFQRPGKLRVETAYQRSSETRLLNNGKGYRGTDQTPLIEVKDQRLLAMVYQCKHVDILFGLLTGRYTISRKAPEERSGSPAAVLHLVDREGPPMELHVDAATGFIIKVTGYFTLGDGRSTSLSSEFSDFRKTGDTVFPFKITNYAGGQRIAETIMKTYIVNTPFPTAVFTP